MRPSLVAGLATVVAGAAAVPLLLTGPNAHAASGSCAATITIDHSDGLVGIGASTTLSRQATNVQQGECVTFVNNNGPSASAGVSIANASYNKSIAIASNSSESYSASVAGSFTVTATVHMVSGSGTLTVTKSSSASPTSSSTAPSGSSPTPTRHHGSSGGSSPSVAPNPGKSSRHHSKQGHHHKTSTKPVASIPLPALPALPGGGSTAIDKGNNPVVAPGLVPSTLAPPTPGSTSSSSPATAVVGGPIEEVSGRDKGLPGAVAALLALGMAALLVRVRRRQRMVVDSGPRTPVRRLRLRRRGPARGAH